MLADFLRDTEFEGDQNIDPALLEAVRKVEFGEKVTEEMNRLGIPWPQRVEPWPMVPEFAPYMNGDKPFEWCGCFTIYNTNTGAMEQSICEQHGAKRLPE